ncbi:hypothetical protein [Streptomyces sp. C]|nr:hypothetical protein [Streptomyces sp. C]
MYAASSAAYQAGYSSSVSRRTVSPDGSCGRPDTARIRFWPRTG